MHCLRHTLRNQLNRFLFLFVHDYLVDIIRFDIGIVKTNFNVNFSAHTASLKDLINDLLSFTFKGPIRMIETSNHTNVPSAANHIGSISN